MSGGDNFGMGLAIYLFILETTVTVVISMVVRVSFRRFTNRQEDIMRSMQLLLDLVHLQENIRLIRDSHADPELFYERHRGVNRR